MRIELDSKVVADEILALSALHHMTSGGDKPLLTRDSLPALRVMMRMVFAGVGVRLGSRIGSFETDESDTDPTLPFDSASGVNMALTLNEGAEPAAGVPLMIKRQLEHLVAAGVMERIAAGSDGGGWSRMRRECEEALTALTEAAVAIDGAVAPMRREAFG